MLFGDAKCCSGWFVPEEQSRVRAGVAVPGRRGKEQNRQWPRSHGGEPWVAEGWLEGGRGMEEHQAELRQRKRSQDQRQGRGNQPTPPGTATGRTGRAV